MLNIRLRLHTDAGVRDRVLLDQGITWTTSQSSSSRLTFTLAQSVAEQLPSPFLVGVEVSHEAGQSFSTPERNLHIAFADEGEGTDPSGMVKYQAEEFVPWLMARMYVRGFDSIDGRVVRWDAPHSASWIMSKLIAQGKLTPAGQPGGGWGPGVQTDSGGVVDSWGQTWAPEDWSQIEWQVGTPISSVVQQLTSQGFMEWWTEGQLFRTQRTGTGRTLLDVVLGGPSSTRAPYSTTFEDTVTNLMVAYGDSQTGSRHAHLTNAGADTRFGELWAVMTQSGVTDTAAAIRGAQPALEAGRAVKQELSFEWVPDDLQPIRDFKIGDTVTARTRGGKLPRRVVGVIVSKSPKGDVTCRTVVGDLIRTIEAKIAARSAAATMGKIIGGSGDGVPGAAPSAGEAPLAPSGLTATSTAEWAQDGAARATTTLSWSRVLSTVTGLAADVDEYEVFTRLPDQAASRFTSTDQTSIVTDQWAPGVMRLVKVRAKTRAGVWSGFSPEVSVTPAVPSSIVPKPPTGLAVASNTGAFASDGAATATVRVTWAAVTQSTADLPVTVGAYRGELEDGQVWVELAETTSREATFTVPTGKARRVRVRARSELGVWGDPSAPVSVTGANPSQVSTAPSAPTVSAGLGLAIFGWDGKLANGSNPPTSFSLLYAETGPSTAGPWTRAGIPARRAGEVVKIAGGAGETVYARLVWVDTLGRTSAASAVVSQQISAVGENNIDAAVVEKITSAVRSVVTEYAVSSSETTAPTTGWSTSTPVRTPGTFVWSRTVTTTAGGQATTSPPVPLTGNTGAPGQSGDAGEPGAPGTPGKGVSSTAIRYQLGASATTAPTGTWVTAPPAQTSALPFLWTRTVITWTDNTSTTAYSVGARGVDGSPGAPGEPGAPGDQGIPGTPGASATSVDVGNDATAIPTNAAGSTTTAHTLTIPFSGWVGASRAAATVSVSGLPSGVTVTTNTAATEAAAGSLVLTVASGSTLGGAGRGEITLTFTCNGQTFTRAFSWAKALAGTAGGAGAAATSIDVGNEATVIVTTAAGATSAASTITIPFTGFVGNTRAAATVAVSGLPSGITVSTNTAGTASAAGSLVLAVASGSTLGGAASGTITLTITCNGIVFVRSFSWSKAIAGATGSPGSPGSAGKGVSSVTPYYLLRAAGTAAPAAPTTNPPGGSWTLTEPGYVSSTELYRAELVVFTDGSFGWTSVSKVSAYTVGTQAITAANLAQASADGKVKASETDPGHDPGRIWLVLNSTGNLIGIKVSDGSAWSSYAMIADQILVPSSIGTISLGDGVITGPKVAAGTLSVDKVEPNFGENLSLYGNGAIELVTGVQADLERDLAQTRDSLAETDARTASAVASAGAAQAGVSAAQQQVDAVRDAQAATQASLAQTQAYFRFANAEAIIGRSDSPTTMHLRNTGLEIREQGVPLMWATAQQIHVPSLVTGTVVFGSHQLMREGTGTVMRAM